MIMVMHIHWAKIESEAERTETRLSTAILRVYGLWWSVIFKISHAAFYRRSRGNLSLPYSHPWPIESPTWLSLSCQHLTTNRRRAIFVSNFEILKERQTISRCIPLLQDKRVVFYEARMSICIDFVLQQPDLFLHIPTLNMHTHCL
jgi:hypothetical protein